MSKPIMVELEIDINKMLGMGNLLRELNLDFDDLVKFYR